MANRWGIKRNNQVIARSKKEVLALVKGQYDIAFDYIMSHQLDGYLIDLSLPDISTIKSGKQALQVVGEILKIDFSKTQFDELGRIKKVGFSTDYLNIARVTSFQKGPKTISRTSQAFTAREFELLLKQQEFSNKTRREFNVPQVKDITFKRGTTFSEALNVIHEAGKSENILNRMGGFVGGVVTSLKNAKDVNKDLSIETYDVIDKLIEKIKGTDMVSAYFKLQSVLESTGEKEFLNVFDSKQGTNLSNTTLIDKLLDSFEIKILKEGEEKKYSDIYKIDITKVRW